MAISMNAILQRSAAGLAPLAALAHLLPAYGYPALAAVSLFENTFVVGMFVPGDALAVLGGAACASGPLEVGPTFAAVTFGVGLGAVLSFFLGRVGGIPVLTRWAARARVARERLDVVEHYFETHGARTVFVGCLVSGLKNLVPAVAGASKMPFPRFALFSLPAIALRSAGLVGAGYAFGASADRALSLVGRADRWLLVGLALALGSWFFLRRHRRQAR